MPLRTTKVRRMRCPACDTDDARRLRRFPVAMAAQHFVPHERDPQRHDRLSSHLVQLWGRDHVEVRSCVDCGFGFAVPFIGGDETFYALAHNADPHYPADRWEFTETIQSLQRMDRPLRIAEVGAGDGAFLDMLRELRHASEVVAVDFDEGAVSTLLSKGYRAYRGSLADIAASGTTFDVVCLFQTLEHMAPIVEVFLQLRAVLSLGGSVFLSVPNGEATAFQEDVTGLWDMPPNHVGRWNPTAIRRAGERYGFAVDVSEQPVRFLETTWQLAVSGVNGRSYTPGTIEYRVNALGSRPLRGALKRVLALARVPALVAKRRRYRPLSCWAHLRLAGKS